MRKFDSRFKIGTKVTLRMMPGNDSYTINKICKTFKSIWCDGIKFKIYRSDVINITE